MKRNITCGDMVLTCQALLGDWRTRTGSTSTVLDHLLLLEQATSIPQINCLGKIMQMTKVVTNFGDLGTTSCGLASSAKRLLTPLATTSQSSMWRLLVVVVMTSLLFIKHVPLGTMEIRQRRGAPDRIVPHRADT